MAITVNNVGTGGNTGVTSISITPASNIPAGSAIIVFGSVGNPAGLSVTDSAGNSYNQSSQQLGANSEFFAWCGNCFAVSTSQSIKIQVTNSSTILASIVYATGLSAVNDPSDSTYAGNTTATASPSVTSGTPSVAGELFVAFVGVLKGSNTATTVTEASGWTNSPPNEATASVGSQRYKVHAAYLINAGSATKTYNPTLSPTPSQQSIQIISFKPAAAASFVPSRGFDPAILAWQPDAWTHTFAGGRQAYEPRLMSPGIPGQSVDQPPYRHPERALETGAVAVAARQWQPDPWLPSFLGGGQPYDQRRLSPQLIRVIASDPDGINWTLPSAGAYQHAATALDQWKSDPWPFAFVGRNQPYEPDKNSPGIPGMSVNQPYGLHPERSPSTIAIKQAWQPDPWPVLLIGGRQPYEQAKLAPDIIKVFVSAPNSTSPFGWTLPGAECSIAYQNVAAAIAWQPDPWPKEFVGGRQPYEQAKLAPSLAAVTVSLANGLNWTLPGAERSPAYQTWAAAFAWQPDAWPKLQEGSWQFYDQKRMPPDLLKVTTSLPDGLNWTLPGSPFYQTIAAALAWQPDPWPSVNEGGWQFYDQERLVPPSTDRPPIKYKDGSPQASTVIQAWQPEAWPFTLFGNQEPYEQHNLSPGVPGMSSDPPPVRMGELGELAASIKVQWRDAAWPYLFLGGEQPYSPPEASPDLLKVIVSLANGLNWTLPGAERSLAYQNVSAAMAWQPDPWPRAFIGGGQPYQLTYKPPQATDSPRPTHPERLVVTDSIKVQWQPPIWPFASFDAAQPYSLRQVDPGIPGRSVDNPPFQTQGKRPINIAITLAPWQPDAWPFDFLGGSQPYQQGTLSPGIARALASSGLGPPVGQFVLYFLSSAPGQLYPAYITAFDRSTSSATITYFPPGNQPLPVVGVFYDPLRQAPSSWSYQDPQDRLNDTVPSIGQVVRFYDGTSTYPGIITAIGGDGTVSLTAFAPGASPTVFTEVNYDYTGADPISWKYAEIQSDFVETDGPRLGQIVAFISAVGLGYPAMITGVNKDGTVSLMGFAPGANQPIGSVAYSSQDTTPSRWQYAARRQ